MRYALAFLALGLTFIFTGTIWCLCLACFSSTIGARLRASATLSDRLNRAAGALSFDQPVIDTLLLSAHVYPTEADHSLDAIAARLGLDVVDRHSAVRDSLLTAAILLRLLDRCEELGITRLGQLIAATDMAGRLRAHQHGFERHAAGSAS